MIDAPELLTVREVANVLRVHEATVRKWAGSGLVRCVRAGGSIRIPRFELERLLSGPMLTQPKRKPEQVA